MITREQTASVLLENLKNVSTLLEGAYNVAEKQRNSIIENDAEGITVTYKAQEEILRRIADADQRAATAADKLAELAGIDVQDANRSELADAAGEPYGDMIMQETVRISELSRILKDANSVNKRLLENGLEIITNCFRTLATEQGPSNYSKEAKVSEGTAHTISLDRKV